MSGRPSSKMCYIRAILDMSCQCQTGNIHIMFKYVAFCYCFAKLVQRHVWIGHHALKHICAVKKPTNQPKSESEGIAQMKRRTACTSDMSERMALSKSVDRVSRPFWYRLTISLKKHKYDKCYSPNALQKAIKCSRNGQDRTANSHITLDS